MGKIPLGYPKSEKQTLTVAYENEDDADVSRRILLVTYVWIDGMNASEAARRLKTSRAWSPKWAKRYRERGAWPGSGTCPEAAGRPRRVRA